MEQFLEQFSEQIRHIRYSKLYFTIALLEAGDLPQYKASMLRGGLGQMMLASNCISDRNCKECQFDTECIVRRVMYSKYEITPPFVNGDDSIGYIINCENYRQEFQPGDEIVFTLTLFGKNIVYFGQYLQALYALANFGIGAEHLRFRVVAVCNSKKQSILNGNEIYMDRYQMQTLDSYINYRRAQLKREKRTITCIKCKTPVSIKYRKEELKGHLVAEAFLESALRRLYMLSCFEGIETELPTWDQIEEIGKDLCFIRQECRDVCVKRFSSTHQEHIHLNGITGQVAIRPLEVDHPLTALLLALEVAQIGKNTSFGFGRIRLE